MLEPGATADNRLRGEVRTRHFEGNLWHVEIGLPGGGPAVTLSILNDGRASRTETGATLDIGFPERLAIALPRGRLAAE